MTSDWNDPFPMLVQAYNNTAEERDQTRVSSWKQDLRWTFLSSLQEEGRSNLIDIGAGTGVHALFFQEQGLDIHCIDLSPVLVEKCREKGLSSQVLSVLDLAQVSRTFDAAFAMNSLLHIPSRLLGKALSNIAGVLEAGGLFYWGQYGGEKREGIYEKDTYQPKRFFSLLPDQQIQEFAEVDFTLEGFNRILLDDTYPLHFQSLLLRVRPRK